MAANLQKHRYSLVVFNRTRAKTAKGRQFRWRLSAQLADGRCRENGTMRSQSWNALAVAFPGVTF